MRQTGFPSFRFDWLILLNVYFVLVRVGARLRFESAACKHWRYTVNSRNLDGLSRITAYLEVKKTGSYLTWKSNKKMWKRGEIAPNLRSNFSYFRSIFNISVTWGVKLHIHLWNMAVHFNFPQFCKSDMSRYGYLEVLWFQRVPWTSK